MARVAKGTVQFQAASLAKFRFPRKRTVCRSGGKNDEGAPFQVNRLAAKIRQKKDQMKATLDELGEEGLEEKLKRATEVPPSMPHRLAYLVQDIMHPQPVLVFEVARPTSASELSELVSVAEDFVKNGAEALCVSMDSPTGLKDLFGVCQAVKVPVVARDWFIHPLQLVEAREAGASGVLGVVTSVSSKGTPVMSSFAAALGLDCPVEVVNKQEVDAMDQMGVPFFAVNVSVGLTLSIPGISSDIARGVISGLPFGSVSLVGVRSMEEARSAREAGADILLVKEELSSRWEGTTKELIVELRYVTSGDD
ncbi:hypothetical protein BSKO_07989 [Bryopsis sp. KO-2023]|nr:hypothetical protein BSKO_07989 [Bryopsis sp. KO-2023]